VQHTTQGIVTTTLEQFLGQIVAALPQLLSGIIFVIIAGLLVKLLTIVIRRSLRRIYPADQRLIVDLIVTVVALFCWFGIALVFLSLVGLGAIAASLGTAAGFIALGISYALSNMIADTVAGVYLLRDPDFMPGDRIATDGATGELTDIGLRKSRFRKDDGDTVVVANRDVEKRWTRLEAVDD
jgi:small-conductance mechanosensitive channel